MIQRREFCFTNWFVIGENERVRKDSRCLAYDWNSLKFILAVDMNLITRQKT